VGLVVEIASDVLADGKEEQKAWDPSSDNTHLLTSVVNNGS
jgi:hypothetical protein